jgi:glycine cleavage system H lipoate-binding protein
MLKVKITDPSQLDGLLSAEDYEKYVKEETH